MLRALLRIALGPILLWQGARVRRDILRMPEAEGPRQGTIGAGAPLSVLLLGDSSIAGVGADTQDQALSGRLASRLGETRTVSWQMLGKTGWTTADALQAFSPATKDRFDVCIVALGVNDVTTETGIATWLQTYTRLIQKLRSKVHARLIILSGLPPMGSFPALPQPLRWYIGLQADAHQAALFSQFSGAPDIAVVPLTLDLDVSAMAEDGFHPGPAVYDAWAQNLTQVIQARLPETQIHQGAGAIDDAHPSSET